MDTMKASVLIQTGFVSEGAGENIFMVKNGSLITPPLSSSILDGITRDSVMKIAKDLNIDCIERRITRKSFISPMSYFSLELLQKLPQSEVLIESRLAKAKEVQLQKVFRMYFLVYSLVNRMINGIG